MRGTRPFVVNFYAPWCGYCVEFEDEYAEAKVELGGLGVAALRVDADNADNMRALRATIPNCTSKVTSFPTVMLFKPDGSGDAQCEVYDEERAAPTLVARVEKWLQIQGLSRLQLGTRPFVVMFYAPWCGHCTAFKAEFVRARAALESHGIGAMLYDADDERNRRALLELMPNSAEVANIRGYPTIIQFRPGPGSEWRCEEYNGAREAPALLASMLR